MVKLPSSNKIIKTLEHNGFVFKSQKGNQVCINNTYLPVGEYYKEKLFGAL